MRLVQEPELPPSGRLEAFRRRLHVLEFERLQEEWSPLIWAVVAGLAGALAGLSATSVNEIVGVVVPVAISVAAVMAGFQTTGQSLMLVLIDSPVIRSLRASGHYERLVSYFWASIRTLAVFIGLALAVLVLKSCRLRVPFHERAVPALLAFSFAWAAAASLRMNRLMIKLLLYKGSSAVPSTEVKPPRASR